MSRKTGRRHRLLCAAAVHLPGRPAAAKNRCLPRRCRTAVIPVPTPPVGRQDQRAIVEQPADQCRLAVVDRSAGQKAQQILVTRCRHVSLAPPIKNSPRASCAPSRPPHRRRSAGPAVPTGRCRAARRRFRQASPPPTRSLRSADSTPGAEPHESYLRVFAGSSGRRSSSTMIQTPLRLTTGRSAAKYSGAGKVERWWRVRRSGCRRSRTGNAVFPAQNLVACPDCERNMPRSVLSTGQPRFRYTTHAG